jgi:DNA-binding LytR/AlgR family response regulator
MELLCYCVDDLPLNFESLKVYIDQTDSFQLIGTETNSFKALDELISGRIQPDIIFLDIDMPGVDGMEIAAAVRSKCKVIFTTAHADYAAQSYDVEAVDYLVKPITYSRFLKAVNKAKQQLLENTSIKEAEHIPEIILLPGNGKGNYIKVFTREIRYIEADSNFLKVFTEKQMIHTYCTMKTMLENLPESLFARIHNSYIINIAFIDKISLECIKMLNGPEIFLTRTYKDNIRKYFIKKKP